MDVKRIAILGIAAIAAGAAAFLVRSMLGGGTPPVQAAIPPPAAQVLVAANDIQAGHPLDASAVRWQAWPKESLSPSFITRDLHPDAANTIAGAVVRTPISTGEPIIEAKIVRAGQAGFMAAVITPGKRAVSIAISAESGAGGFILPNDHVDVILTRQTSEGGGRNFQSETILRNVRVLAIDQTFQQLKDTETAVGKTATLELAPSEAELIALAQASGTLSLALRGLTESADTALSEEGDSWEGRARGGTVSVIRYGVAHSVSVAGRGQ